MSPRVNPDSAPVPAPPAPHRSRQLRGLPGRHKLWHTHGTCSPPAPVPGVTTSASRDPEWGRAHPRPPRRLKGECASFPGRTRLLAPASRDPAPPRARLAGSPGRLAESLRQFPSPPDPTNRPKERIDEQGPPAGSLRGRAPAVRAWGPCGGHGAAGGAAGPRRGAEVVGRHAGFD